MPATTVDAPPTAHAEPKLSYREIATLFLPLALTSTMMSISVPIINAGLARLPDPEPQLAAFSLAFSLSILLESPVFALQQGTVASYGGGPVRDILLFSALVGLAVTLVFAGVAFSPLGATVLRTLMGAPEALIPPALHALRVAVCFPLLVAVRIGFQGVLIARHRSSPVAWGTFLRLILLSGLLLFVTGHVPLEPPAAAMAALATAVALEMFYVAWAAVRSPHGAHVPSPAQRVAQTQRGRIVFLLPLSATMALSSLTNPLINAFISRSGDPESALAVYAVAGSLVWFLASPTLAYSAVTIALGTTPARRERLASFLWRAVGGVSLLGFIVTLTPFIHPVLEDLMGLSPELASRARWPLVVLSLQPLVAGFIAHHQGVLTREARTLRVGLAGTSRVAVIVLLGIVGLAVRLSGELLGGFLLAAAFAAELLALIFLRRRVDKPPHALSPS